MEELDEKKLAALESMRQSFAGAEGCGMALDDRTYLRYLRAR